MVVIDRHDGALRGDNVLALFPSWAWLGLLSPMPLFFAAAGWSHGARMDPDSPAASLARLRDLVLVASVVAVGWSAASLLAVAIAGDGNVVSDGARLATQPLWFLAAYVPFLVLAPWVNRIARQPVAWVAVAVVAVGATDWLRFGRDWPRSAGFVGFFLVWGIPWLLGSWWRSSSSRVGFDERRTGVVLAAAGLGACAILVHHFGYSPSLIDAVPGRRTNTTPPTLFTLVASVAQVGVFMTVASLLDRIARRRARVVSGLGASAVGVYAWHLTALAVCGAALAAGVWAPERFGTAWWWTRIPWFAAVVGLTVGLARLTQIVVTTTRHGSAKSAGAWRPFTVVVLVTAGAAVTGLYGPRSVTSACVVAACFALAAVFMVTRPAD